MFSVDRYVKTGTVVAIAVLAFACGGGAAPKGPQGHLTLLAGRAAGPGNFDGVGAGAGFFSPNGIASDSAGNVFVADSGNHTIRKITPAGVVSTFAGTAGQPGSADGNGVSARLNSPAGIAVDSAGNVYVADTGNSTIRKITATGSVSSFAGAAQASGSDDGDGAAARFVSPWAIATDRAGNLYVADSADHVIRKITPAASVTTLAGTHGISGSADGSGTAARFNAPSGVATDADGNVYVADSENHTIRKITSQGVVSTLAGTVGVPGAVDARATLASFSVPAGLAMGIDDAGDPIVYVADSGNSTIRKISASGAVITLAGAAQAFGSTDGTGPSASFLFPNGVALDGAGQLYVADTGNNLIRKLTAAGTVSTLAGTAQVQGNVDAVGPAASFFAPRGIATDLAGNVYVADTLNRSVRSIASTGGVTTLSLTGGGFDPVAAPEGIAVDRSGNVYMSDIAGAIFKLTPAGELNTLAGALDELGNIDGAGAVARFNAPAGIAVDVAGNVYVADSGNATIRKIAALDGAVSTLAGSAGVQGSVDGTGPAAQFAQPWGIAADDAGNVYVVDRANNNVRRITPGGAVTTLAGNHLNAGSADGVGTAATFNQPRGIALDGANNVYVADTNNNTIRAITRGGVVSTIAGVPGRRGFVPGTLPGALADPVALAVNGATIYVLVNNSVVLVE
ncbi:MAG: hypothetical protein WA210_11520 [Burkholderiaceae bacterium]